MAQPGFDPAVSPEPLYRLNPDFQDRPLDQVAYLDFVHPTTATQSVVGTFAATSLTSRFQILDGVEEMLAERGIDAFYVFSPGMGWSG